MLTNWKTISQSIKRLKEYDSKLAGGEVQGLTKKEQLNMTRERDKLDRALGGIKEMGGLPDLVFIIDTDKEHLAVDEARRLGVPTIGILDSNANPAGITFPVPGNDDAVRAIGMYCDLIADAVLDGISEEMTRSGADAGAQAEPRPEPAVAAEEAPAAAPAAEPQAEQATA
jgi:small subunit ribosomal protein S2